MLGFRVNAMLKLMLHDLSIIILIVRVRFRERLKNQASGKSGDLKMKELRDLKFLFFFTCNCLKFL